MRPRPVVFGEVLFDSFPDGQRVLGGAPFNVAWHLKGFGSDPLLVSRVGADDDGAAVRERMRDWSMDDAGLQVSQDHPTGRVVVELAEGQPRFDIRPDQAYDHIDPDPVLALLREARPPLLYRGTLAARQGGSARTLRRLQQEIAPPVYLDVNLRPPWWRRQEVLDALAAARWAKLNDDELVALSGCEREPQALLVAAERARVAWGLELLLVTRGAAGAVWADAQGSTQLPTPRVVDLVDTVGAGDAFSAVTILGLLEGWDSAATLGRALEFAGEVCRHRGAVIGDAGLYREFRKRWEHEG